MGNIVAVAADAADADLHQRHVPRGLRRGPDGRAAWRRRSRGSSAANFVAAATSGQIRSELAPGVDNLEGLLFPDTYQIGGSETEAQIVARAGRSR